MKWASWTDKGVVHRLSVEFKVTSCGLPAKMYARPWKWSRKKNRWLTEDRVLKDKSRKPPTCLECIAIEAEFGEPRG